MRAPEAWFSCGYIHAIASCLCWTVFTNTWLCLYLVKILIDGARFARQVFSVLLSFLALTRCHSELREVVQELYWGSKVFQFRELESNRGTRARLDSHFERSELEYAILSYCI